MIIIVILLILSSEYQCLSQYQSDHKILIKHLANIYVCILNVNIVDDNDDYDEITN